MSEAPGVVVLARRAEWLEQPVGLGRRPALDTAAVCVLGFEHGPRAPVR